MKVLLISPPRIIPAIPYFPPLGLGFIGAVAKQDGHRVKILDAAGWTWDELSDAVKSENPDLVGLTCWPIERGQAFRTADIAREAAPDAKIVIGGPHASAFPHHMFIKTPTDYVVVGEGEETFRELLSAVSGDGDVSDVKGIAYCKDGEIRKTEQRPLIRDMDTIPPVLHEQFDYSQYRGMHDLEKRAAAVFTSRGCPFKCIYCSSAVSWRNKYRKRSVNNVLEEVKELYSRYGIRSILFFDDNLIIDRKRLISFCKGLCDLNLDLTWAAEGSVRVDADLLKWMKKAGCYRIDFGVESGSPKILKNIKKAFTVDDTRKAFKLCREAGIRPNAYLMIGSPGENKHTIRETIKLMREIQPDIGSLRPGLWILPDTQLHEMSLKSGLITEYKWLSSDETFIYTEEHSVKKLESFVQQFDRGMAIHAGLIPYLRLVFKQFIPARYYKLIRRIKRGVERRIKFFLHASN